MCGIAGIASLNDEKIEIDALKRMMDLLRHRGPDDEGMYLSRFENPNSRLKVGLGHRRLSIIDLQTGHQPMANEDKSIWIIFNGEIYNFPELKEHLIGKNHRFATKSDTEVIIHLYEDEGISCLKYLRGMFAFCIWDAKNNLLFLARDRVGKKPLYYFCHNGIFIFASESKSILEHNSVKRELDLKSLDSYLTYGYVPAPDTIFSKIKKLPPAHCLIYDGRGLKIERYWDLSFADKKKTGFSESKERLYGLLSEATKMRLISDVPLGVFLSGGVDSSCVVALMSRFSSGRVRTFSIGFEEEAFNELRYARFISKRFSTEHKEFIVKPNAIEILPKLAWHYGEPFGDSSSVPTYYVSKMTREFVKVALTGDGGDESFAGYNRYRGIKLAEYIKYMPKPLLKTVCKIAGPSAYGRRFFEGLIKNRDLEGAYLNWLPYFNDEHKDKLYTEDVKDILKENRADLYLREIISSSDAASYVEKMVYADIKSCLPEDYLAKTDTSTMANSLEGRSPFLDHKLMEFAASLPLEFKLQGLNSKYILKETFKKDIPISFLNRHKKGFSVPVGSWFRTELKDFLKDMLLDKRSIKRHIFSGDYIDRLIIEHCQNREDHTHRLWALLSFELWQRIFIDRQPL